MHYLEDDRREDSMEVAEFLLQSGVDVNGADINGWTALHHAADNGTHGKDVSKAKLLIHHGADVNRETDYSDTALHIAMFRDGTGQLEMVSLLLEGGKGVRHMEYR